MTARRTAPAPAPASPATARPRLAGRAATAEIPVESGEAPLHALERMFRPRSLAVIGGSDDLESIGGAVVDNLLRSGFAGRIDLVNLRHDRVRDRPAVRSVRDLAEVPDLALVTSPPASWARVVDDLGRLGAGAAVLLSAGSTASAAAASLASDARRLGVRLLGPTTIGLARPSSRLDATFARALPRAGPLALVTRSGAALAALLDLAEGSGIGVSTAVCAGDEIDVGLGDILDFLTFDPTTRSIALVVDAIDDSRSFTSALRAAARTKPVVALQAGAGLARGSERAAFRAMLARCGAVGVDDIGELFSAVESLSGATLPRGDRLAVVANGPGLGRLAADACVAHRITLATLPGLDNPLDAGEAATAKRFVEALDAVAASEQVDAVLAVLSPTRLAGAEETAQLLIAGQRRLPTLYAVLGLADGARGRQTLNAAGHVVFETPDAAVRGFAALAEYQRNQRLLLEAPRQEPQARPIDEAAIDRLLQAAAATGSPVLDAAAADALLAACGIASAGTFVATDVDAIAAWSRRQGYPVVLATVPGDASAPVEQRRDIRSERELRGAAAALQGRWLEAWPKQPFAGFRVRRIFDTRNALPLRIAIDSDPTFGPVLSFGAGGGAALLAPGLATALPPLSRRLADDLVTASPMTSLLGGSPAAEAMRAAAIDALLAVSALAVRYPAIRMLRIDPLQADARGVTAIDTQITIDPALPRCDARHSHLAIHPYPVEAETRLALRDGTTVFIRPMRPDDAERVVGFFDALSEQSRHWRFLHPIRVLTPQMIARFTQIDYERDMALVALPQPEQQATEQPAPERPAPAQIVGVARYIREASATRAEFAIVVADAWQGVGLAHALMDRLVAHARGMGLRRLVGHVHGQNHRMIGFMRRQGFRIEHSPLEPGLLLATADLEAMPAAGATDGEG